MSSGTGDEADIIPPLGFTIAGRYGDLSQYHHVETELQPVQGNRAFCVCGQITRTFELFVLAIEMTYHDNVIDASKIICG
jgi:hypothetical protein